MSNGRRMFTLEEANAMLPRVRALVAEQIERRKTLEAGVEELSRMVGAPVEGISESADDPPEVAEKKRGLLEQLHVYQASWNVLEDMGVQLKDARTGLLDFYGKVDGKTVFLCWIYPEESITHYHDLEAGFSGRKPIEGAVKNRMYN